VQKVKNVVGIVLLRGIDVAVVEAQKLLINGID
jgi:hypothetical protein